MLHLYAIFQTDLTDAALIRKCRPLSKNANPNQTDVSFQVAVRQALLSAGVLATALSLTVSQVFCGLPFCGRVAFLRQSCHSQQDT